MHDLKIVGSPGNILGNTVVKTGGSSTIEFSDGMIRSYQKRVFGLEVVEAHIPIEEVTAVQMGRGITWWLFWLGIVTLAILVGVVFIVLAFVIRSQFVVIHTNSMALVLFPTKTENPKDFVMGILEARRLSRLDS